ncbi:MAG: hypothetical protein H6Q92_910 [Nitrospirae bacterium]|jgi:hypothetical protein|nr:hypothetical protein [Nitrospirota bacterium]
MPFIAVSTIIVVIIRLDRIIHFFSGLPDQVGH